MTESLLNPIELSLNPLDRKSDGVVFGFKPIQSVINLVKVIEKVSKFFVVFL